MQENKDEIYTIRKDDVKFDNQCFLTLVFDCLALAKCKYLCADVKRDKSAWVKVPAAIDNDKLIADTTNLYINYKPTGELDEEAVDKD